MLLLLIPQGGAQGLELQVSLNDVVYRLGLASGAELSAPNCWVGSGELFQYADDAAKRLAYLSGVFLAWDASITVIASTATYNLPASHVFTVAAWLGTTGLRITPVRDLWALDGNWPATTGPATRCSLDAGAVGILTLYPNPTAGGTLGQVCQEFPPTIQAGNSALALSPILQDYFSYAMLAGARGRESDYAQPEMAEHYRQRMALYEQIIHDLWGPGA